MSCGVTTEQSDEIKQGGWKVKCISLWQPWASLIALGAKTIETRSWPTNHCGPMAIHASKRFGPEERDICLEEPFYSALESMFNHTRGVFEVPLGAILCIVDLQECLRFVEGYRPPRREQDFGDFGPGRYGWQMKLVRKLETPVPFKGSQGFFEVPDELLSGAASESRTTMPFGT